MVNESWKRREAELTLSQMNCCCLEVFQCFCDDAHIDSVFLFYLFTCFL